MLLTANEYVEVLLDLGIFDRCESSMIVVPAVTTRPITNTGAIVT